jgi:rhomboid protease GluP
MRVGPAAGIGDAATDTDSWAACALACCWPLVRSAEVHFATNIPQKVLTGALRIYLQIQPDELLLAIIDRSGGRSPAWGCALTTRRLHWAGRASASFTSPHPGLPGQPRPPLGRSIAYADLTKITRDGMLFSGVEPGTQDRLSFGPHGIGVPEVLVDVLKNLCRAARREPVSPSPAAEEVARRDLPTVIRRTEQARAMQGKLRSFPELLKVSMPRVVATPVFAAICIGTFAMMVGSGISPFVMKPQEVWTWGANNGPSVIIDGERSRLLPSMFLHFGFLHLVFNMWCLLWFGPLVERLFGSLGFAALYLLSGLGGSIASLWYHTMAISAGASGAIFGIFGGLIGYLIVRRDVSPRSVLELFRPGVIFYLAIDSLLGLAVPSIDGAAHLGGLATGCLCGLMLHRPWPPPILAASAALARLASSPVAWPWFIRRPRRAYASGSNMTPRWRLTSRPARRQ